MAAGSVPVKQGPRHYGRGGTGLWWSPVMVAQEGCASAYRDLTGVNQSTVMGAKLAVKWRSIGGSSTMRIPGSASARSATQRATSIT